MGFRSELGGRRKPEKRAEKWIFPTGLLCQGGRVICHKIKFRPPRKEEFMIDAREEILAPASHKASRRPAAVAAGCNRKSNAGAAKKTARVERVFSDPKVKPFDQIGWDRRTAEITDDAGKVIFKQENVEVPRSWSLLATKVVVSKYFYGELNTPERETSVRQLVHRISRTMADWGVADGYFSKADGEIFYDELTWLCLNQYRQKLRQGQLVLQSQDPPGRARHHPIRISPGQRLLHPVGPGQHGGHHAPRPERSDALQIRLRHRHGFDADSFEQGKAQRRRPAQRPDEFSESL
jgi:hypothetical protein